MNSNDEHIKSIVREIESKYDRLGKFINHNYTQGVFREKLIKDVLKNYLSSAVGLRTGFIKSISDNRVSRQIDILLLNENMAFNSYYRDDDIVIARSDAVLCAIEVKSNFTKESLKEVESNLLSIKEINPKIRYSAFFYNAGSVNHDTIHTWFEESFVLPSDYMFYPDRLSILGFGSYFLNKNSTDQKWRLSFSKPHTNDVLVSKSQILTDFVANSVGYCSKLMNNDKSDVYSELGFGEWILIESNSYI
jgi:hypothetical protein